MRSLDAPWSAEKTDGGYRVRDARRRTLCYICCRDDEKNAEIANVLTCSVHGWLAYVALHDLTLRHAVAEGEADGAFIVGKTVCGNLRRADHALAEVCHEGFGISSGALADAVTEDRLDISVGA